MSKKILIVSHADGDGHLIAEQVRRNLLLIPNLVVNTLVDASRTQGHQIWKRLSMIPEIEDADVTFFTDLMFSPVGFGEQSSALTSFCREHPAKRFFAIDHHPMPYARLCEADNIRAIYRPEVFECAFGPRSGLMVVAAICEHQQNWLSGARMPHHDILALGVRRAAAINSPLCGGPLMSLLRAGRWDVLRDLGIEDRDLHRTVRGRRIGDGSESSAMSAALEIAKLCLAQEAGHLKSTGEELTPGRNEMPYDVDLERFSRVEDEPPRFNVAPVETRDLEALVSLLEVAALSLTTSPEATFAIEELIIEARNFAGEDVIIEDEDIKIVLKKASFLKKLDGNRLRLR